MSAETFRQDMPPKGGYNPIFYKRVPAKTFFKGRTLILGYLGMTAGAMVVYGYTYKEVRERDIERRSAQMALYPMLLAERDREYLKQLRRNREEEARLMANVEGWEVGTYYGEPIYNGVSENALIDPRFQEYYVHAPEKDFAKRAFHSQWS